jgi:hypothetical protein
VHEPMAAVNAPAAFTVSSLAAGTTHRCTPCRFPRSIARTGSGAPPPATGRATSSKWCILICCFVSAAGIALMVGLSVGLSGGDDSGGSNGSSEAPAAADTTVTVYGASLPSQCEDMATSALLPGCAQAR